jgi:diaminopropionate ammonia-lyase
LRVTVFQGESYFPNPLRGALPAISADQFDPLAFHQTLPGYAPTALISAPHAAEALGAAEVLVKDESSRLGLPAFKIVGASWAVARAVHQALVERGLPAPPLSDGFDALHEAAKALGPMELCCATDGNHGRAVAHMAKLIGFAAKIFVPDTMSQARVDAIASEGAEVVPIEGTYDDAIKRSADEASRETLVISDTSWPGYSEVPRWVVDGYATIFREISNELSRRHIPSPEVVGIQIGVGALAAATVPYARSVGAFLLGVEPYTAACIMHSLREGEVTYLPGNHPSIMAGLNAGLASETSWPMVSHGLDAAIAIDDRRTTQAMRLLAKDGIVAGETGAAGLAGLLAWADGFGGDLSGKRVLVINTEGATDPKSYARIVGTK